MAGGHRPGRARGDPGADLHHQGHRRAGHPDPRAVDRRRADARPRRAVGRGGGRGRGADGPDLPLLRLGPAHRARPADRPRAGHPADRRRLALPAGRPGDLPLHRAGAAPQRLAQPRHRVPALPGRRDERAPGLPGPGPRVRRRAAAAVRGRDRGGDPEDLPGAQREGDPGHRPPGRAARHGGVLPATQGRPRPDGLLRPDRPDRPARPGAPGGRGAGAGQVQGGPARRVPGHLGGPGPDAQPAVLRPRRPARSGPPGDGRGRPQPGDLRLAGRLGVEHPGVRRVLPVPGRGRPAPTR